MKIDLIVYDFDGVMTNNTVIVSEDGKECVICNRDDGWAIKKIREELKIEQLILTAETNSVIKHRARKLDIECVGGIFDKALWLTRFCMIRNISIDNVLYVGNGLNDLEIMNHVGYSIAPADAHLEVRKIADFVTNSKGGEGVILEIWYSYFGGQRK